ncbi:MAG: hypothetical protein M3Q36_04255 [bacterium]|nr:hypothetical protein [bacterium]
MKHDLPRLELDSLSEFERHEVWAICETIIALELEPSPIMRAQIRPGPAIFTVNQVVKRDISRMSTDPLEILFQLGASPEEIQEAYISRYEDRIY